MKKNQKSKEQEYLDIAEVAIVALNKKGQVDFINRKGSEILGYAKKDIIGKNWFDEFLPVKLRKDVKKVFRENIIGKIKPGQYYENPILTKEGKERIISWHNSLLYDEINKVIGTLSSGQDVTDQRHQEERLKLTQFAIDHTTDSCYFISPSARFIYVNDAACRSLGYTRKELLLMTVHDIDPNFPKKVWLAHWKELREKGTMAFISSHRTKDGTLLPVEICIDHLKYLGKEYNIAFARDITNHKKQEEALRESEEKYRRLIESAVDAIFLADRDTGTLVDVNSAATELVGRSKAELIGTHQTTLHSAADKDFYSSMFKNDAIREPGSHNIAYVEHKDKRRIPVQISATPIELKGKKLIMGIFRDITNLKTIEDTIRKDKNSLARIVEKKSKDLSIALKSLEDRKRLSDIGELSATVAHELRNPLGVINAALYNIKKKSKDKNLDIHISTIEKKITESDQIIKNLLTYSRIRVPKFQTINIARFFDEILDGLKSRYSDWDLKIEIDSKFKDTDTLQCDPVQLNSLISNILDNACQSYNEKKCHVSIIASLDKKRNKFELIVKDNGSGISKSDLTKIFEPFYTTKPKGIGLGLPVCKQVVNLHDGEISIDSEKSRGTSVSISLPISRT